MKNKKWVVLLIVGVFAVSLAACAGGNPDGDTKAASDPGASGDVDDKLKDVGSSADEFEGKRPPLPQEALIPVGTLMLEDTEFAVDTDQAAALLTLWKAYRSLIQSDTASSLEVDAILGQIEDAMTVDQLRAISEMDLATENLRDIKQVLEFASEGVRAGDGTRKDFTPGVGTGEGLGGGKNRGFEGDLTQEQIAKLQAQKEQLGGGQNQITIVFVEALIELLEAK